MGYPYLTWAVVVVIPLVLGYMAFSPDSESRFNLLAMTAAIAVVVVAVSVVVTRKQKAVVRAGRSGPR